jgi:DNA-binding beta-propeller fold protein YncE
MASIGRTPARRGRAEIYVNGRSADRGQGEAHGARRRCETVELAPTRNSYGSFLTMRTALLALMLSAAAADAVAQPLAYVSGRAADTGCQSLDPLAVCQQGFVSVVNTATNQVERTIEIWRRASGNSFSSLHVSPDGTRLYAVTVSSGSFHPGPLPPSSYVRAFDTQTAAQLSEFAFTGATSGCALSADGARLFCPFNVNGTEVRVIDLATGNVTAQISSSFPRSVALSPSGRRLYIARGDSSVAVHDAGTYAELARISLPSAALSLASSPDGAHVYAGLSNRSVADIDTATNTIGGVIPDVAPGSNLPLSIAFAKQKAYVAIGGGIGIGEGVAVIDVATRTMQTGFVPNPLEVSASLDESRVFVAREFGLTTIDTSNGQTSAATLPDGPGRLALSPPAPFAEISIDTPAAGAVVQEPFIFGGWAVDVYGSLGGPGIDTVHVWAYPAAGGAPSFVGAAEYGRPRPDIAALLGSTYLASGYQMSVSGLAPGAYSLVAFGRSTRTGTFSVARQVSLTVGSSLRFVVDTPASGASVPPSFTVAGWALDVAATSGTGVAALHVWAYPASGASPLFAGAATLGVSRPDVAAIFGTAFGSAGYTLTVENLPPGSYTLVPFVLATATGSFTAAATLPIVVTAPQSLGAIDIPAPNATLSSPVRVAGWAIELGGAAGTGIDAVHVWAYPTSGAAPVFVGAASYGGSRPDVGAIFGTRYTPSGFDVTGPLPPGNYDIVAFAHSSTTNSFSAVRVVRVTVQ